MQIINEYNEKSNCPERFQVLLSKMEAGGIVPYIEAVDPVTKDCHKITGVSGISYTVNAAFRNGRNIPIDARGNLDRIKVTGKNEQNVECEHTFYINDIQDFSLV